MTRLPIDMLFLGVSVLVAGLALSATAAQAQSSCVDSLLAPGLDSGGHYGFCTQSFGDTLVVSELRDNEFGADAGAVHVFGRTPAGWVHESVIRSNPPIAFADFGVSLALGPDRLVVGALSEQGGAGAVYVFDRSQGQWTQSARLTASDSGSGRLFGYSVDLEGDRLVAGSPAGAAYVFEKGPSGWLEVERVTGTDSHGFHDRFGQAVTLEGETLVVGAYLRDEQGFQAGAVYVFRRIAGNWQQQSKLFASDAGPYQEFGNRVDLCNGTLVVAAPYFDVPQAGGGAAYAFREVGGSWTEEAKLTPTDLAIGDRFGNAATNGDQIVAGTRFGDGFVPGTGAGYVFERSNGQWLERGKIVVQGGIAGDEFGSGISLNGSTLVMGSTFADQTVPDGGAAFTYDLSAASCWQNCGGTSIFDGLEIARDPSLDLNANGILDACECQVTNYCIAAPNSTGLGAQMAVAGLPSVGLNSLTLLCSQLPPNTPGLFFYGPGRTEVAFGNGYRCVAGAINRTAATYAGPSGLAGRGFDLQHPLPGAPVIAPGSTWNFQFWYRNPAGGGAGFNLSNGLAVRFCP